MLAPEFVELAALDFYGQYKIQSRKNIWSKPVWSQLAAKTASELIVCIIRTDRIDEMAKRNVNEFPFPEAPFLIKYYKYIPYNYKTGYLNAFSNFKEVAFKVARTLDKQMPVSAFSPADAKLWATKTTWRSLVKIWSWLYVLMVLTAV